MSQCGSTAETDVSFSTHSNHTVNDHNYYSTSGTSGGGYMTTGSPYGGAGGSPGSFARVCWSFLPRGTFSTTLTFRKVKLRIRYAL